MLLTTIAETGIVLVDCSSDEHSSHRHVYMAEVKGKATKTPTSYSSKSPRIRLPLMLAMKTTLNVQPAD
jgi:hypothetical protein